MQRDGDQSISDLFSPNILESGGAPYAMYTRESVTTVISKDHPYLDF